MWSRLNDLFIEKEHRDIVCAFNDKNIAEEAADVLKIILPATKIDVVPVNCYKTVEGVSLGEFFDLIMGKLSVTEREILEETFAPVSLVNPPSC